MRELRYERTNVCAECLGCGTRKRCEPARAHLRPYGGIRLTSDGFDCALPVSVDSHSYCSYACRYCFSSNLMEHRSASLRPIGQTSIAALERVFAGGGGRQGELFRGALKYDQRANGYPCPIQLGALNDPCDLIERQQGWLLSFLGLVKKYRQPVRISTKGDVFLLPDYQKALGECADLVWVAFSCITPDDEIIAKTDKGAPNASRRLETMAAVTALGAKASLRLRPMLPGVSDSTRKHPRAYAELMRRAKEAGASAVSCEVAFVPGAMTKDVKAKWAELGGVVGRDLVDQYLKFGPRFACMRPAFGWTEGIMHAVLEEATSLGLTLGVSDPVWKQLSQSGCCCGIPPNDPVFGNWERHNATNALVQAKASGLPFGFWEATPAWADSVKQSMVCDGGVGPLKAYSKRHDTLAQNRLRAWNDLRSQRGPLEYFQGAVVPCGFDDSGNRLYSYKGLERQQKQTCWKV